MTDPGTEAFDALLAAAGGDTFVVLDAQGRIQVAGIEAARLAGRDPAALVGMSVIAAFGSAPLDEVARRSPADLSLSGEARLGANPERRYTVEALPLAAGGRLLWLRDVTVLAHLTQVRRDFVANISHELRTPLTAIKLLAETLANGTDDVETARGFALQIEREVDQMAQLVEELLDLSTIESGAAPLTFESTDPAQIMASVAERITPVAERQSVHITVVDGPPGAVTADPQRLAQALLNLAHNAVKFSHPGGEVRLGWSSEGERVRFWVADDGIGIAAQHQHRIWERFYKADRARARSAESGPDLSGSAGLGLAIVRHIAEAHGGAVGLTSVEGKGSTFWIEVPASRP